MRINTRPHGASHLSPHSHIRKPGTIVPTSGINRTLRYREYYGIRNRLCASSARSNIVRHTVKEIALRRKRLQSPELAGAPSTVFTMLAGQLASAGGGGDSSDYASEPQDLES